MDDAVPKPEFGIAACCKLIGLLVLAYVALVTVVHALPELGRHSPLPIGGMSDSDLRIAQKFAIAILSPMLMILVTLILLIQHFPGKNLKALLKKFGLGEVGRPTTLVFSFLVGLSMILAVKELMQLLPPGPFLQPTSSSNIDEAAFWVRLGYGIMAFTLVPIAEEFVFRGVLYEGVLASSNKFLAASAVSVLFTAAHVEILAAGYWQNQLLLLVVSVVLILARQITGSIYSPILIHSGFNFGSLFIVVK